MSIPPPPKSPTTLIGGVGFVPGAAEVRERTAERDVVDVVARGLRVRAVLAPARSSGRRRASGCGRGRRRARCRAARSRRAGSPRSARRPARRAPARSRPRRGTSGRRRSSAGRGSGSRGSASKSPPTACGAVDADDLGAHVREHHRGERTRPDPGDLDDLDARQRSRHVSAPRSRRWAADVTRRSRRPSDRRGVRTRARARDAATASTRACRCPSSVTNAVERSSPPKQTLVTMRSGSGMCSTRRRRRRRRA